MLIIIALIMCVYSTFVNCIKARQQYTKLDKWWIFYAVQAVFYAAGAIGVAQVIAYG